MLSSVQENPLQIILVTSSTPNEGKTTTASNLAVAMAQMGEKVLLVDTDMRRHNLHKVFALDNLIGVSDMIVDHANIEAGMNRPPHIPNLTVITGGTLSPNPSELLGSRSMGELLARFRKEYDRIILDSPPFLAFSDPLVLSRLADGVLFVVLAGVTPRDSIRKSTHGIIDHRRGPEQRLRDMEVIVLLLLPLLRPLLRRRREEEQAEKRDAA
jgi:capsular exopolysaccharide synthesis family protein